MGSYTLAGGRISNDDDIQFLYAKAPEAYLCEICQSDLSRQSTIERQTHYERHFSDDAHGSPINVSNTRMGSVQVGWLPERAKATDNFWYPAQPKPPPHNFSPGLLPVLRRALIKCHAKDKTRRAVLCYDRTVHIAWDFWDAGWGCGYRNYLMACTALMDQPIQPVYFPLLDDPMPPSVRNLQHTIEIAWKDGYDTDGAKDLKNKLVGTKKWIGTAELYTAFIYRGIPARLVDFNLHKEKGVQAVTDWIVEYFSPSIRGRIKTIDDALRGASPVTCTDKMPLILQHNGHSRTIVGYEISPKGVVNLLCFDSAKKVNKTLRRAGLESLSSTSTSASSSHKEQPRASSSVLQPISHPIHKRRASNASSGDTKKRPRSGESSNDTDDDVVIIDDPTSPAGGGQEKMIPKHQSPKQQNKMKLSPEEKLNFVDTVSFFRLDPKALGRKKEYQILYFPLSEPLSQKDKLARKEVHSTRIC